MLSVLYLVQGHLVKTGRGNGAECNLLMRLSSNQRCTVGLLFASELSIDIGGKRRAVKQGPSLGSSCVEHRT